MKCFLEYGVENSPMKKSTPVDDDVQLTRAQTQQLVP